MKSEVYKLSGSNILTLQIDNEDQSALYLIDSKKKIYHLVKKGDEFVAEADTTRDLPSSIYEYALEQNWNSAQVSKNCIVFDGEIHSTQVEGLTESVKSLKNFLGHK